MQFSLSSWWGFLSQEFLHINLMLCVDFMSLFDALVLLFYNDINHSVFVVINSHKIGLVNVTCELIFCIIKKGIVVFHRRTTKFSDLHEFKIVMFVDIQALYLTL